MIFVLDAGAMIAYLRDEPGAGRVSEALLDSDGQCVAENADIGTEFWQAVGALKAIHRRVSLADCFAVALANKLGTTVLTADHHGFDALADQGVCAVGFIR